MSNTEEETFDRLRRTPFDQVMAEFVTISDILGINNHLKRHGWTPEEFNDYYQKHYIINEGPLFRDAY